MKDALNRLRAACISASVILQNLLHRLVIFLSSLKRLIVVDIIEPQVTKVINQGKFIVQNFGFGIHRIAAMVIFLLVCSVYGYGQTDIDVSSPAALFGNSEALYGLLVMVGGYLSAFIPGLNRIDDGTLRVLAWAILTGTGFALFGSDVISLALSYALSTSVYEVILQWFKKSPKTEAQKTKALKTAAAEAKVPVTEAT